MNPHPGSWLGGLTDFGVTEELARLIGRLQGVAPSINSQGGSNLVLSPFSQSDQQQVRQAAVPTRPGNNFSSVLGAATGPGGGGGVVRPGGGSGGGVVNPVNQGGGDSGQGAADLALRAAMANANSYRERGMKTFDDIMKSVGAFRERAGGLKASGEQDIINTAAGELGSNAKTAQQLAGSANAQGRNLGLSSKINLGQKIMGNLQGTQGSTLAAKGSNLRRNDDVYQGRIDQAQDQENQANQYKQGIESGVSQIQAGGLSDYSGALQSIVDRSNALAAINPLQAGGLTQVNPDFSGVTNTLNGIFSGTGGGAAGPVTPGADAGSLVSDPSFQAYLKKYMGTYQG